MAFPVILNGRTYTLADFEGTNYVDGFPDALEDFVTQAGDIYNSTSTSSVAIGTGSKSFTIADSGKPYQEGTPLRIADAAAPETNFMDCIVTSYSGTSLVVESIGFGGSGTKSSWTINIGGAKTVDGTLAINQGGTGATTASAAASALGLGTEDSPEFTGLTVTSSGDFSGATISDLGTVTTADINGGTIDGTTIGGSSAAAGTFTSVTTDEIQAVNSAGVVIKTDDGTTRIEVQDDGDVSINSGQLFVDQSNGRIGIGETTPLQQLHINADNASMGMALQSADGGACNLFFGDQSDYIRGSVQYDNSDESMRFKVNNNSEAARFDSSGNLDMTNGGGDIIMANGAGIDFSASEGGGADNSLLDDYEQGTWTPSFANVSVSYTSQSGNYKKVGNIVHCDATINVSFIDNTDASEITLDGLPFAPSGNNPAPFSLSSAFGDLGSYLVKSASNLTVDAGLYVETSGRAIFRPADSRGHQYTQFETSGIFRVGFSYQV